METMGDRIRHQRRVKGLSQLDVATHVGVTKGAVSQWENGQTNDIRLKNFLALCEILGATPSYLIFGLPDSQVPPPSAAKRLPKN